MASAAAAMGLSATVVVAAAKPRRMVFGVGSRFYPRSRISVGYWVVNEILGPKAKWRVREDLLAEVAEVGDTVYVKPMVHILEHNKHPLVRVREFLGLSADKVTVVHYDENLPVGEYVMTFGGRIRNNAALTLTAAALKEEGFGRMGVGVGAPKLRDGHLDEIFTLSLKGISMDRMNQFWLANRMPTEAHEHIKTELLERIARDLSGTSRAGSIYDPSLRV